MGNRANRRKPSRKEKISKAVSTKYVYHNGVNYTLHIYISDSDHQGAYMTRVSTGEQGVVYTGDNYPSIGYAINATKREFLGIEY